MKHKNYSFAQVPKANIQRSSFDRSSTHKTTFDAGLLVPFFCDEALPGDTFNLRTNGFARLATPIYPIMDNMYLETFYFFVPHRLVWDNFQKFMGEQVNPGDSTDFLVPQIETPVGGWPENSMADYYGIPTKIDGLLSSALPFRAADLIYNEWFRDQNLQNSLSIPLGDGPDSPQPWHESLRRRGKRHDYFTSALPWPQKGEQVDLPLGDVAPVVLNEPSGSASVLAYDSLQDPGYSLNTWSDGNTSPTRVLNTSQGTDTPNVFADLSQATAASINQLRQAFQIQKLLERDARSGSRYTEVVRAHFGVVSPDARLQRPEFLGGGRAFVNINPVTSTTDLTSVGGSESGTIGRLSAVGTTSFQGHGFTKSFTEHGTIIGFVNVRADLTYQQGLNRMWTRRDKYDFYWPALAHLGEQTVLNKEIYADGTPDDDLVFGYQERFAEYRYKPSIITGLFRSNATGTLDAWHLSQDFANTPTLDSGFIQDSPPLDRVIAVPSEPHFIADFHHKLRCARPMPLFGVPGNIDRF